jgi:hypothetical protein
MLSKVLASIKHIMTGENVAAGFSLRQHRLKTGATKSFSLHERI